MAQVTSIVYEDAVQNYCEMPTHINDEYLAQNHWQYEWPPYHNASVNVDGEYVVFADQLPVIIDGRTLVPVRGVFEHLGFYVHWDDTTRQAILTNDDYTVIITVGSSDFITNDVRYVLDVPARIINGRAMLPIRAVLESVGYYVSWDSIFMVVLVNSEPPKYVTIRGEQFSTALTRLDLGGRGLNDEDIKPLRYMRNLTLLWISGNEITDLSPIANLTNLTVLLASFNRIDNVAPLSGLLRLGNLQLEDNAIADITPLSGLTNLTFLALSNNKITDISVLSNLPNLDRIWLWGNQIPDWSPVDHIYDVSGRPCCEYCIRF